MDLSTTSQLLPTKPSLQALGLYVGPFRYEEPRFVTLGLLNGIPVSIGNRPAITVFPGVAPSA
jgi:hypothetical protein